MELSVIALGRQFGSGGREIGKRLAENWGIPCYDRELIALAAQRRSRGRNCSPGKRKRPPIPGCLPASMRAAHRSERANRRRTSCSSYRARSSWSLPRQSPASSWGGAPMWSSAPPVSRW